MKVAFQWKVLVTRIVKCHESCIPMKVFGCKNYKMSQIKDAHHEMFQIDPF